MNCRTPGFPVLYSLQSLLRLMSIELVMPSNPLILSLPLLLLSVFLTIRVIFNELALCIRWPKYWSFSFSISPLDEYSGLISFRIDWGCNFLTFGLDWGFSALALLTLGGR